MRWQLILKEFGPNIQHIAGVDNIIADMLNRFPYASIDKYESRTIIAQCRAKELFAISRVENNKDCFPLNILNLKREQQKEPRDRNSKLSTYIFVSEIWLRHANS